MTQEKLKAFGLMAKNLGQLNILQMICQKNLKSTLSLKNGISKIILEQKNGEVYKKTNNNFYKQLIKRLTC